MWPLADSLTTLKNRVEEETCPRLPSPFQIPSVPEERQLEGKHAYNAHK